MENATTDRNQVFLSVIIPCFNESKNITTGSLDSMYQYLISQSYSWEMIIVNDGSSDDSKQLIQDNCYEKEINFVDMPHGGKPKAVWAGLVMAKGEIVLIADMDQSTPISEIEKLLPWYTKDIAAVIGSRGCERTGFSQIRKIGSKVFLKLRRFLLLKDIIDTQCGFKSFRRQTLLEVFPKLQIMKTETKPEGWSVSAYDVELLFIIQMMGYKIKEVVVEWKNNDLSTTKHHDVKKYIQESISMAYQIFCVFSKNIRGYYRRNA